MVSAAGHVYGDLTWQEHTLVSWSQLFGNGQATTMR